MAALDFPTSPTLNQTYTANGATYRWDGTTWVSANVLPVTSGGTGVMTSTGTGSVVLNTSPTFAGTVNLSPTTYLNNSTNYAGYFTADATRVELYSALTGLRLGNGSFWVDFDAASAMFTGGVGYTPVAASSTAINCSLGNCFSRTVTGAATWSFTNVPTGRVFGVILELTNGGLGTQTWPTSVKWPSGTAPTLTSSGVDLLGFITRDGGTTWRGVSMMTDSK